MIADVPLAFPNNHVFSYLPSGKLTQLLKNTPFTAKTRYKWPCSIATLTQPKGTHYQYHQYPKIIP